MYIFRKNSTGTPTNSLSPKSFLVPFYLKIGIKSVFLGLLFLLSTGLQAQSWSENLETGDRLYEEGRYGEAAEFYEKAWRTRTTKRDLLYKAGECYFWAKNYRKAADCYSIIKTDNEEFDLVGLKYARALKQDGRYREAKEAFKWFSRDYDGPGKKQLDKIIMADIQGCDLALEAKPEAASAKTELTLLPELINTIENEFSPVPFTDDLLYFSSNFSGKAMIYRTMRENNIWSEPVAVEGLPMPKGEHIGNGCFSPDGARFYFTECAGAEPGSIENRSGLRAQCTILLTSRQEDGSWSEPKSLPSYINFPSSTATHPYVYEENGQEVLLFTSDRRGGIGGLDLYATTRSLESNELDFSLPQNLGDHINTGGDEITPFYDQREKRLYFSSNGLVSMGGMDIFSAEKKNDTWGTPQNEGLPYNSSADDFGLVLKKSGYGGFLVSNRTMGTKIATTHEDIFEFKPKTSLRPRITAKIFAVDESRTIPAMVKLYEKMKDGSMRLLTLLQSTDGSVNLPALENRSYVLEVSAENYTSVKMPVTAKDGQYHAKVFLEPIDLEGKITSTEKTTAVTKTTASAIHYRVQIEAINDADTNVPKYDFAKQFGELASEFIEKKGLYRMMIGPFYDKNQANDVAREMRTSGAFPQAYVVKYNGNMRM